MDLKDWKIFKGASDDLIASVTSFYAAKSSAAIQYPVGLLLTRNNDLYTIRDYAHFRWLGVDREEERTNVPVRVPTLCGTKIVDIKNTSSTIVVLTSEGRLYEWGNCQKPKMVTGNFIQSQVVVEMATGINHCLCRTQDGQVYAWGCNIGGKLGIDNENYVTEAQKIKFSNENDVKIQSIACGGFTSYAVDHCGNAWSWGYNNKSLGYLSHSDQFFPKIIIAMEEKVQKVVGGYDFAVAISNQGYMYWWGNICGTFEEAPQRFFFPENILNVATAASLSFAAFQTDAGVYVFGNRYQDNYSIPVRTEYASIDEVFLRSSVPTMIRPMEVRQQ